MPLYEYECRDCKDRFEDLQPMDASVISCACGAAADRLISKASIGLCETTILKSTLKTRDMLDNDRTEIRTRVIEKEVKKSGVSTTGKWYDPTLALYVGDPMAWVGSIDDIKAVCKIRGWECKIIEGEVKITIPGSFARRPREQFGGSANVPSG